MLGRIGMGVGVGLRARGGASGPAAGPATILQPLTIANDTLPESQLEGSSVGALVGFWDGTPPDLYYIDGPQVVDESNPGQFYLDYEESTPTVFVNRGPDFETAPNPTLTVRETLYLVADDSLVEERDSIIQLHVTNVGGDPTLAALTMSGTNAIAEGSPQDTVVGTIQGKTAGSTLVMQSSGAYFGLNGTDVILVDVPDYEAAATRDIVLREYLGWAANGPYRDTTITITITNITPSVISVTPYESGASAGTTFTPFSGLDLSNCSMAVFAVGSSFGAPPTTSSTGWVRAPNGGNYGGNSVFYKLNPTNNETLVIALQGSGTASGILFRCNSVTTYGGENFTSSNGTNPDPAVLGNTGVYEWVVLATAHTTGGIPSAGPSGYSGLAASSATTPIRSAGAYKVLAQAALSENPGAFTATTGAWTAFSVSIR